MRRGISAGRRGGSHRFARISKALILALIVLSGAIAQQPDKAAAMPIVAGAAVPLYPPLARATKTQGVVRITTDGTKVVGAKAEDGNHLLAVAAEENARTWRFSKHARTSFTVIYRYRLETDADPNNPTATLRFPIEVDVSMSPLTLSDPPAEIKK